MMEDIAPKLLEGIQGDLDRGIKNSAKIKRIMDRVKKGTATYADVDEYAVEVGGLLSEAYSRNLSSSVLPGGKMHYNIADRIIYGMLEYIHNLISDAAGQVQEALNEKAGIGIRAIKTPMDKERAMGIVNKVSAAETFDGVAYMLGEPVVNFAQGVVTETIKSNVDFHGRAGLRPTITRTANGGCCKWCEGLAGTYKYPDVPKDVYRRHRYCRCVVAYDPGDGGKRVNVHTQKVLTPEEEERLAERKRFREFKCQNVTAEYFGTARPGEGQIVYQEGYKKNKHRNEINVANLLHDKFGGDIKLLAEINERLVKTPDYVWRNHLWELKSVTTEKSADTALRHAIHQIKKEPGGVILDYRDKKVSIEAVEDIIDKRMKRSDIKLADIMIILKNDDIRIYRYKK